MVSLWGVRVRVWFMRAGASFVVSPSDRLHLEAVVGDRNTPQKHVWRCRIVLLTAEGAGTSTIMRMAGVSKTAVWRWHDRFMTSGDDGLLRDKTRPPRIAPLGAKAIDRVVALTLVDPPRETTHWMADMMAKARGISASAVRRIWKAHGLQPHRYRQFKLSSDPRIIDRFVIEHNTNPKLFTWNADPDKIIAAVNRGHQALDSIY